MSRVAYYLFWKPLSLLPLPVLYAITWPLYGLLAYVFRYRNKVMRMNLAKSFPQKALKAKIKKHLGTTKNEFTPFMNPQMKHQFVAIYSSLKNEFMNEVVKKARSKMGSKLIPRREVGAFIRKPPKEPFLLLFAADQSPDWKSKLHWTQFLNQTTGVATGAERYAQMLNWVVVFGHITKVKRGTYEMTIEVLTDKPKELPEGEITEMHVRSLEKQILKAPEYWLWTHKRWKKKTERNLEL